MPLDPRYLIPETLSQVSRTGMVTFKAGEAMTVGDIIYFNGMDNAHPIAFKASALSGDTSNTSLWLCTETIGIGKFSSAKQAMLIAGVDTSAASVQPSPVYLSETDGGYEVDTNAPTIRVRVGEVLIKDATNGAVYLRPQAFSGVEASGGGGGGNATMLVWRPGGVASGNVATTWSGLVTLIGATDSPVIVWCDPSAAGTFTITTGTANLAGKVKFFADTEVVVNVNPGAQLDGGGRFEGNFQFQATSTNVELITATGTEQEFWYFHLEQYAVENGAAFTGIGFGCEDTALLSIDLKRCGYLGGDVFRIDDSSTLRVCYESTASEAGEGSETFYTSSVVGQSVLVYLFDDSTFGFSSVGTALAAQTTVAILSSSAGVRNNTAVTLLDYGRGSAQYVLSGSASQGYGDALRFSDWDTLYFVANSRPAAQPIQVLLESSTGVGTSGPYDCRDWHILGGSNSSTGDAYSGLTVTSGAVLQPPPASFKNLFLSFANETGQFLPLDGTPWVCHFENVVFGKDAGTNIPIFTGTGGDGALRLTFDNCDIGVSQAAPNVIGGTSGSSSTLQFRGTTEVADDTLAFQSMGAIAYVAPTAFVSHSHANSDQSFAGLKIIPDSLNYVMPGPSTPAFSSSTENFVTDVDGFPSYQSFPVGTHIHAGALYRISGTYTVDYTGNHDVDVFIRMASSSAGLAAGTLIAGWTTDAVTVPPGTKRVAFEVMVKVTSLVAGSNVTSWGHIFEYQSTAFPAVAGIFPVDSSPGISAWATAFIGLTFDWPPGVTAGTDVVLNSFSIERVS